jgi:hypothetical protein
MPSPGTHDQNSKIVWFLGGAALLFLIMIGMWLGSFGQPEPAVSADPVIPGVRTSPFDAIDDDGTVVLNVPRPAASFELRYVIPTSIETGAPKTIGLFGNGFPDGASVSVEDETVTVLSATVQSTEHIEVELLASEARDSVEILVIGADGSRASIELAIEP